MPLDAPAKRPRLRLVQEINLLQLNRSFISVFLFVSFIFPLFLQAGLHERPIPPRPGPATPIILPVPPGQGAVTRCWNGPINAVYGLIESDSISYPRYFILPVGALKATLIPKLPPSWVQPADLRAWSDIKAWTWDASGSIAYYLNTTGHLFRLQKNKRPEALGQVAGTHRPDFNEFQVSRAFFFDPLGRLYTGGKNGVLYRYTPGTRKLEALPLKLPALPGREAWASLDTAVESRGGIIWATTSEGFLFSIKPDSGALLNLGKPLYPSKIVGLVWVGDKIIGVGATKNGPARAFILDPATHSLENRAFLIPGYAPPACLTTDYSGNIIVGATGRLGGLYLWSP
jgi:hypothetical protein